MIMERIRAAVTAPPPAESADSAEKTQRRGLRSPQVPAETCGKPRPPRGIRNNPQAPADSTGPVVTGFPQNPQNPQPVGAEGEETQPACTLEWLRGQGCYVLPEDVTFIAARLPRDTRRRNATLRAYVATWRAAMEREPLVHRKEGRGRFAANTALLEGRLAPEVRRGKS